MLLSHIVDVLDEDKVGFEVVKVLDKSAMASRPEHESAVGVAERFVVHCGGHGVGRRLLERIGYLNLHALCLADTGHAVGHGSAEKVEVGGADGIVQAHLVAVAGVGKSLHDVLFGSRARAVGVVVEQDDALGFLPVAKAFGIEHQVNHLGMAGRVATGDFAAESEIAKPFEEFLIRFFAVHLRLLLGVGVFVFVHVLEHAGGSARGRDELQDVESAGEFGIVGRLQTGGLGVVDAGYAVAAGGGADNVGVRKTALELTELFFNLLG